jgi:putative glutathione S-transferase
MADLIEGKLSTEPIAKVSRSGEFQRPDSSFRGTILKSEAEAGRFHLYVSFACPWAHRTLIARKLKKLERYISVSVTNAYMGENGWTFDSEDDPKYLAVVYLSADKKYSGKISVPVLWDKKKKGIVNNESSEIIRIFNSSFDDLTESPIDLYPTELKKEIDEINDKIYHQVNNGVYKTGFASTQNAYEKACRNLFITLDELDILLSSRKFLVGDKFTEADVRLFTTLIRFDPVYYGHFKCNLKRIIEYKHLYNYMKCIYQIPEVKETCHFDHIKEHYYKSHSWINPNGIVPLGPVLELDTAHDRGKVEFHIKTAPPH